MRVAIGMLRVASAERIWKAPTDLLPPASRVGGADRPRDLRGDVAEPTDDARVLQERVDAVDDAGEGARDDVGDRPGNPAVGVLQDENAPVELALGRG
jgi:hypothetical protein